MCGSKSLAAIVLCILKCQHKSIKQNRKEKGYMLNIPGSVLSLAVQIFVAGVKGRFQAASPRLPSFLDYASETKGGKFPDLEVEGVKAIWGMTPVYLTVIMYWTVSNQVWAYKYVDK